MMAYIDPLNMEEVPEEEAKSGDLWVDDGPEFGPGIDLDTQIMVNDLAKMTERALGVPEGVISIGPPPQAAQQQPSAGFGKTYEHKRHDTEAKN